MAGDSGLTCSVNRRRLGGTGSAGLAPSAGDPPGPWLVLPAGPDGLRICLGANPGMLEIAPARRRGVREMPGSDARLVEPR
eukprot:13074783-Alexandrium_andersonii.AAC.1